MDFEHDRAGHAFGLELGAGSDDAILDARIRWLLSILGRVAMSTVVVYYLRV